MAPQQELLSSYLEPLGLCILGALAISETDCLDQTGTMILIGPEEPAFWGIFKQSTEFKDRRPDPIDRWSSRVLAEVAASFGATPYFPFGGAPYHPFYSWALRTGRFWASPISFLVHDTAGLFTSFRGALLLPETFPMIAGANPCETCADQPCLTACPVGAFANGYDVPACKTHLHRPEGTDCMSQGCRARRACPVGQGTRIPEQAAHHMKAFR